MTTTDLTSAAREAAASADAPLAEAAADGAPRPDAVPAALRLALPKGRMERGVIDLLGAAGIELRGGERAYRPAVSVPWLQAKLLKPKAVASMLAAGSRDVGFTGADRVAELELPAGELVELLDTGFDAVRLVSAAPPALLVDGRLPDRPLRVATGYPVLTRAWAAARGLDVTIVDSEGATEVFPPEDADAIVDLTASGATLAAHGLVIEDRIFDSTTRLYASRAALADPGRAATLDRLVLLLRSVIEARARALLEVNVPAECLDAVVAVLPCMKAPTIAPLHGDGSFAVRAAVPRAELPALIPLLKARGGRDVVVSSPGQIVP